MNHIKKALRPFYHKFISWMHKGNQVECNCCGTKYTKMRTLPGGHHGVCWLCESYPRTRAIKITIERFLNDTKANIRMLHIAPDVGLREWLKNHPIIDYVAVDKRMPGYEYPKYVEDMDITNLKFDDNSFDFVLCSHVLEHVFDDKKAMSEIRRVLKPEGCAIIQVPIDLNLDKTDEERPGENLSAAQRLARFRQSDHVRIYGRDYFERMEDAGLHIDLIKMSEDDCKKYDLFDWEDIMTINYPSSILKTFRPFPTPNR